MSRKPVQSSTARAPAEQAPPSAAPQEAVAAEAGAQAPANNTPRAQPTEAADIAAASAVAPETAEVGWPLPAEAMVAIKERPELRKDVTLVVKAKSERGRRRAGRAFTREATPVPLIDLSDGDVAAIEGDPELVVTARVTIKSPAAA